LLMLLNVYVVIFLGSEHFSALTSTEYSTLMTLTLTFTGFLNLIWLCQPFTKLKILTVLLSFVLLVGTCLLMPEFFTMTDFSFIVIVTFFTIIACSILILLIVYLFQGKFKFKKKKSDE